MPRNKNIFGSLIKRLEESPGATVRQPTIEINQRARYLSCCDIQSVHAYIQNARNDKFKMIEMGRLRFWKVRVVEIIIFHKQTRFCNFVYNDNLDFLKLPNRLII